ncbi:hypothetical protein NDU88_000961 [Pleurodeles waltl]|uniref:Uncharacterized protein n=1 Tax=Pleurodeles waltl TaxID=8319 RepID=A0AAV7NIR4_PLEWA|nr:hypothetical protein NDU88_000961 [Pleurodeles waltl]
MYYDIITSVPGYPLTCAVLGLNCGVSSGPSLALLDSADPQLSHGPRCRYRCPRAIRGIRQGKPCSDEYGTAAAVRAPSKFGWAYRVLPSSLTGPFCYRSEDIYRAQLEAL